VQGTHGSLTALVEHFFPKVLDQGVPTGFGIWILFDHDGKVLRSGEERFQSQELRNMLETRFPSIRTSDIAVARVDGPFSSPRNQPCAWKSKPPPLLTASSPLRRPRSRCTNSRSQAMKEILLVNRTARDRALMVWPALQPAGSPSICVACGSPSIFHCHNGEIVSGMRASLPRLSK
jgi:hypothetical protein